jgi:hypothetical protein
MSLRLPQNISSTERKIESGWSALERELKAEQASNLGRIAGEVEKALEALRNASKSNTALRTTLINDAAQAVWRYFAQREACGMMSHEQAIETYAIPNEVLARVGAGVPSRDQRKGE